MSRAFLAVLLLLHVLITVIQGTSPKYNAGPRKVRKYIRREKKKEIKLPKDIDLDTITLKDLVNMRPGEPKEHIETQRYNELFANHPEVKKINLRDTSDPIKTSNMLAALSRSREGKQPENTWLKRMSTSVNHLIDNTPFDNPEEKAILKDYVKGVRHKGAREGVMNRFIKKHGKEETRHRKKMTVMKYKAKHGISYDQRREQIRNRDPNMDLPLAHHLGEKGQKMTAGEVEKEVRTMGHLYSSPIALSTAMKKYFKAKKVPPDELKAVVAVRSNALYQKNKLNIREKRRDARLASGQSTTPTASSVSASSGASQPFYYQSRQSSSSSHPPSQGSHLSTPSQQPAADHGHHNDEADWSWLTNYLNSDQ